MFSKIQLGKEISALEMITILSIVMITYGFFYQYFFFNAIGVGWIVNLLSPNLILLTSMKVLVTGLISISLGYGLARKYYLIDGHKFISFVFVILCMLNGVLGSYFSNMSEAMKGATSFFLMTIYTCSTSFFFFILFKLILRIKLAKQQGVKYMPALVFTLFLVPFLFIFVPWNIAQIEANKTKVSPSFFYNKAVLDKDKSEWYLINVTGEKALVQSVNNNKVFRYIDMKDIGNIYAN